MRWQTAALQHVRKGYRWYGHRQIGECRGERLGREQGEGNSEASRAKAQETGEVKVHGYLALLLHPKARHEA